MPRLTPVLGLILCAVCDQAPRNERPPSSTAASAAPTAESLHASTGDMGEAVPKRLMREAPDTPGTLSNPCGGTFVEVTLRTSAANRAGDADAMRAAARRILSEVEAANDVRSLDVSPAIAAFRIRVDTRSRAESLVARLQRRPDIAEATVGTCSARVQ